jgi:hypothetical protein
MVSISAESLVRRGLLLGGYAFQADMNAAVLRQATLEASDIHLPDAPISIPPETDLDPGLGTRALSLHGTPSATVLVLHGEEANHWLRVAPTAGNRVWGGLLENLTIIHQDIPKLGTDLVLGNVHATKFRRIITTPAQTGAHGAIVALQVGMQTSAFGIGGNIFEDCIFSTRVTPIIPGNYRIPTSVVFANGAPSGGTRWRGGELNGCQGYGANIDFQNTALIDQMWFEGTLFKDSLDSVIARNTAGVTNLMCVGCTYDGASRSNWWLEPSAGFGPTIVSPGWMATLPGGLANIHLARSNGGNPSGFVWTGGYASDNALRTIEYGPDVQAIMVQGVYAPNRPGNIPSFQPL